MDLLPPKASPLQLYSQAKRLLRTTSRAREADWYREASEINLQWHLWIGAQSGVSAIYSRSLGKWWAGPDLPAVAFETDEHGGVAGLDKKSREALHELINRILSTKEFGGRAKSLGIIIHLADGIRIRDLAPEFAADEDFTSVNELLISAPDLAIGDDTVDNRSGRWRLLPFLGAPEGEKRSLAVQISAKLAPIAEELRRYGEASNLPLIVNVRSAPLESLSGLAYLYPEIQETEAGCTLCLIQYETLTLLFAVGNRAELLAVRPIPHRGKTHLGPTETYDAITQAAASLNIKDPRLVLLSVTGMGVDQLTFLLETYRDHHPRARFKCLDGRNSSFTEGVPGRRFEFAASVKEAGPVANEAAFQKELRERWTRQDFYGLSLDEVSRIPTRGDLRLLKFSRLAQKAALIALLGFCAWAGVDFVNKMRSEAWRIAPDAAQTMEFELFKLQKERREWQHWDSLLRKRSEGWLAMEALLEMFPSEGGVILKNANYRVETEDTDKKGEVPAIGVKRAWDLAGFANPEVASNLPTLGSRTRIAELLNEIAERNHAPYLSVSGPTRQVDVTLQQKQGAMPASLDFPTKVARHFRTSFELNISQGLTNQDEFAIITAPLTRP